LTIWHVFFTCLVLAILSAMYHRGGILHPELELRLPYYLSNRPLLSKLFDSRSVIDTGLYRARELSYLLDFIDNQFIALSVRLGFPHFLSLVHYVFAILIGCILWQFSVRELKLNVWIGLCLVLLWWTSPTVFLSGIFFRTAKIGTALTTVILYFYIYNIISADRQNKDYHLPASNWWICFAVSFMSSLLDEQGLFTLGLIIAFLLLWILAFPNINLYKLLGAFISSLVLSLIYRFYAAPYLTFLMNQYWPSFSYQQLPWSELFSNQSLFYLGAGPILYIDTLRFLIGNIPETIMGLFLVVPIAAMLIPNMKKNKFDKSENKIFWIVFIGLLSTNVIFIIAMYSLMLIRHPALFFEEVRLSGYYFLPATAMFSMTLAFLLSRVIKIQFIPKWVVFTFLILAIAGNVIAIPQHEAIQEHGFMQAYFQSGPRLLDALKNINNPQYSIGPDIEKDPVYQFFRNNP
jgi:hypothetical protein